MFLQGSIYVPSMGMFGSQCGNISFPTWEYIVPLMGLVFEIEVEPASTSSYANTHKMRQLTVIYVRC